MFLSNYIIMINKKDIRTISKELGLYLNKKIDTEYENLLILLI